MQKLMLEPIIPGAITPAKLRRAINNALPVGTTIEYSGTVAPDGFLVENGSAVSRSTYADLYSAIGTQYGSGNGSTTFNIPDSRRRTAIGAGGTQISGPGTNVGDTGGSETHTLSVSQMPSHSHGDGSLSASSAGRHSHGDGSLSASSAGSHRHNVSYTTENTDGTGTNSVSWLGGAQNNTASSSTGSHSHSVSGSTSSAGSHSHSVSGSTGSAGSGNAHNNMQPSIVKQKCIKY